MLFVYNFLLYLITPFLAASLLLRSIRAPEYRKRIKERFGLLPEGLHKDYIWLHSVSVGETVAAEPLVKALLRDYPQRRLLVTTMTPTGSEQVFRSFGDKVDHVYAPYDLPGSVRRFLNNTAPCMAVIMETELWPNVLRQCSDRKIPTALINARLSKSSAAGYARAPSVSSMMMSRLGGVAAQSQADGERFVQLGLPRERLRITGSIKFDHTISEDVMETTAILRKEWQGASKRPVWIAASTHSGEDEIILQAHRLLLNDDIAALLILVPRHPERFEEVYTLCASERMQISRRSSKEAVRSETQLVLGDTMGELAALYGACDIAFVGGSLVARGGHNPIEPAAWGLPVLVGEHTFNFQEIVELLLAQGGAHRVYKAEDIAEQVKSILIDSKRHAEAGAANKAVVEANRGATQRQLALVRELLPQ
ncbi:MAG: lipid IV(A) 3-deoxy-D-manno-octulosonic acid transferase [Pseudomonadales bacterium]